MAVDINNSLGGFTGGLGGGIFIGGATAAYTTIKNNFYSFVEDVLNGMDAIYGILVSEGKSGSLIEKTPTWTSRERKVEGFLGIIASDSRMVVKGVFSYAKWEEALYYFIKDFELRLLKDLEPLEKKEAAKKQYQERVKFIEDVLAKLPSYADAWDSYAAVQSAYIARSRQSKRLTQYSENGDAFTNVNRSYQGWFGVAMNPTKSMLIQYVGARCESEDGFQRPMPVAILRYNLVKSSSGSTYLDGGEIAYYGSLASAVKPGPSNVYRYANGYMFSKIPTIGLYLGSIYIAAVFYYSEGVDSRQNDRYHYGKTPSNYDPEVDMEIASSVFTPIETNTQDPNDKQALLDDFRFRINPSDLQFGSNEQAGIEAANIALATKGPFSARKKEAWSVIQRPLNPGR